MGGAGVFASRSGLQCTSTRTKRSGNASPPSHVDRPSCADQGTPLINKTNYCTLLILRYPQDSLGELYAGVRGVCGLAPGLSVRSEERQDQSLDSLLDEDEPLHMP